MKQRRLRVLNFSSIIAAEKGGHEYPMTVGPNKAGNSKVLPALGAFYEDINRNRPEHLGGHLM